MPQFRLKRLLRGSYRAALDCFVEALGVSVCVQDVKGRVLYGEVFDGATEPLVLDGKMLGGVIVGVCGEGSERDTINNAASSREAIKVVKFLQHLCREEMEKLSLAQETLGRYKELTLLYDLSESLSRVLRVEEVAEIVVLTTKDAIQADEVSLLLCEQDGLSAMAQMGDAMEDWANQATREVLLAIGERIASGGHGECINDLSTLLPGAEGAVLYAPLRTGDETFGMLRVLQRGESQWTAGDLKLLVSLASSAASALRHAILHHEKLNQMAVRNRLERFVSPQMIEAALSGKQYPDTAAAIVFCDLRQAIPIELEADVVMESISLGWSVGLRALLGYEGLVHAPQEEMLLAVFHRDEGFADAAHTALKAAKALQRELRQMKHPAFPESPGIGVVKAPLDHPDFSFEHFLSSVNQAAELQAHAGGRILIDEHIVQAMRLLRPDNITFLPCESSSAGEFAGVYQVAS